MLVRAFEQLLADIRLRTATIADYAERETLYAAAVHSSNLAFLTTDTNGIITGWNPGAERLFGYSSDEAVGRDVEMLVPTDRRDEVGSIRSKTQAGLRVDNFGDRAADQGRQADPCGVRRFATAISNS